MGPPELPGGNRPQRADRLCAPVLLQWGRRNYPAETVLTSHPAENSAYASMGPPELPGGNSPATRAPRAHSNGFNGAAGITRRKQVAISRPPPWCASRFNGAAGITRRKRAAAARGYRLPAAASMGPPELPGGNRAYMMRITLQYYRLQWGRRNYPAETLVTNAPVYFFTHRLQWGRRNYPAETGRGDRVIPLRKMPLQWGRRNYPAET